MLDAKVTGEDWLRASRAAEDAAKRLDFGLLGIEVGFTALLIVAGVATTGTGGILAIASGTALVAQQALAAGSAKWTQRSAVYRGNFERTVLGVPSGLLESEDGDRVTALSDRDRVTHPEDPTSWWFNVTDPSGPEGILAIRESLVFGRLLRVRWLWFVGGIALAVCGSTAWYSVRFWPLTSWKLLVAVIAILLVASTAQRARALRDYVRIRDDLDGRFSAIQKAAEPHRHLAFVVLHERLCQVRRRRPLVPTWFYEHSREVIDRQTASVLDGSRLR